MFSNFISRSLTQCSTALVLALLLAACSDGGSTSPAAGNGQQDSDNSDNGSGSNGEDSTSAPLTLESTSTFGRISLAWEREAHATVLYSSDPDCNWDAYTTCPHSDLLPQQESGLSLGRADGLDLNRTYYFVAEVGDERSPAVPATPWAPGINSINQNSISASLIHDDTWYLGGAFRRASPATNHGALFDLNSGRLHGALVQADNAIQAVAPDGEGGWYVGGDFRHVNGHAISHLAHIRANGSLNTAWQPSLNYSVSTLTVHQDRLYVGGHFSSINGEPRERLAAFDLDTGDLTDWGLPVEGRRVSQLAVADDRVYISGNFSAVSAATRNGVAALGTDGNLLNWHPEFKHSNHSGTLHDMLVHDGKLYIGGWFNKVNDSSRSYLAVFDSGTGDLLDTSLDVSSTVRALAADGQTLFLGGTFSRVNGEARVSTAAMNTETGALTDWHSRGFRPSSPAVMVVHDDVLYIGGDLRVYDIGPRPPRQNLVAVDTHSGNLLDFHPEPNDDVLALAAQHGELFAGGAFTAAGGVRRDYVAGFDRHSGELVANTPTFDGIVRGLEQLDDSFIAIGSFSTVNGEPRRTLARFKVQDGTLEPLSVDVPNNAYLTAAALTGRTLYLTGQYITEVNDAPRNNLFAVHADTGEVLNWDPEVRGNNLYGWQLAHHEGMVYANVVGMENGDGEDAPLVAYHALGTPNSGTLSDWNPQPDNTMIDGLAVIGEELLVSGAFTTFDGVETGGDRNGLASFDTDTHNLTDWDPEPSRGAHIQSFHGTGDRLYVGGSLSSLDGSPRDNLVALNLNDRSVVQGWAPFIGRSGHRRATTNTINTSGNAVYVTGYFNTANGQPRSSLAIFDTETGELIY